MRIPSSITIFSFLLFLSQGLSACSPVSVNSQLSRAGQSGGIIPSEGSGMASRLGTSKIGKSCVHSSNHALQSGNDVNPQVKTGLDDLDDLCLGLKYVVYDDPNSAPVVSPDDSVKNIQEINSIWSQCKIAFQIDEYLPVNPSDYGLGYNTSSMDELDPIRKAFQEDAMLVVVTTGVWDRTGSLGSTAANAWTSMPGEDFLGVVLESAVGTYSNIIAHELGHYLSLDHVSDGADLMNPIIYQNSMDLSSSQCRKSQLAIRNYWKKMIRSGA